MASFEPTWIQVVLIEEGGSKYTDTPGDLGGPTRWGLTIPACQTFWGKDHVSGPAFIRNLDENMARAYYGALWQRGSYGDIVDQTAATKCFSAAVNMGRNGVKCAQRAAGCLDDGCMGPGTVRAVNAKQGFCKAMCDEMLRHYEDVIAKNPSQAKFRAGWLARAKWGT
jgi:lysozyme family protein